MPPPTTSTSYFPLTSTSRTSSESLFMVFMMQTIGDFILCVNGRDFGGSGQMSS